MALRFLPNMLRSRPTAETTAAALRGRDAQRLRRYQEYLDFYNGRHWDGYQEREYGGRTRLVLNYARAIVDKGVSYLLGRGVNFAVPPVDEGDTEAVARAELAEQVLYQVYQDNDLDAVDLQAATNGAILGDSVFKVFWDAAAERVRVVNVDPFSFFARWAADDLSVLRQVDVAYTLPAEDIASTYGLEVSASGGTVVERWTDGEFVLLVDDREVRRGRNPYGFIPFVHIPNLQPAHEPWGVSDLRDIMGLNRELNARMSDQADIIRYHSDPPVIFKGVNEHSDLPVGPGTVWDIPADADVKLLEWRGQPVAVQEHLERLMRALYEVAETPRTAFGDTGRLLSGVALEIELRPILQKTHRKRVFWAAGLRRRNAMVLKVAERFGVGGARSRAPLQEVGYFAPYRSRVIWPPLLPRDDALEVRNNVALVAAGLRSHRSAMDALGEERPEEELRRVVADRRELEGKREG